MTAKKEWMMYVAKNYDARAVAGPGARQPGTPAAGPAHGR